MDWLQQVSRVAASANQALTWTAPSGFIAHQSYLDVTQRRIRTRSRGEFLKLTDYTETQRLDRVRQANGISPNFVHSMDAAVMMLTIEQAVAAGVSQFAMIHDSYGTVAADTDTLAHTLRRAFVDMYENHDVLAEFAASVSARLPDKERLLLPSLPSKGNLDLQSVLTSDYFFA
jgi:DNA-directed RNA polymerase